MKTTTMSKPSGDDPRREADLPLSATRVIDLTDGVAESSTRLLAELGVDVVLAAPPEGLASRHAPVVHVSTPIRRNREV
jgi:crotonobetainyl-CoA:carnitine CoA-transferase CaiB-like acyl-CoA transferase